MGAKRNAVSLSLYLVIPVLIVVLSSDLQSFRQALSVLQAEVDELDRLKGSHYSQILDHEEEIWDVVAGKVCLVVRSSLDVFDRVTAKAYVLSQLCTSTAESNFVCHSTVATLYWRLWFSQYPIRSTLTVLQKKRVNYSVSSPLSP